MKSVKEEQEKEDVMVREDYLFLALLLMTLIFFVHWGGTHHLRH
jgi:hypothetical protein